MTLADLMSDIVVLIASLRFALLLCLSPSYNFIFTIDLLFIFFFFHIRFRSGLYNGHFIIFSLVNYLCSKKFTGKFRYMRRSIVVHKCTFHFETKKLELISCKESLVHKVVSTVQFNSFINFKWSNNGSIDNSSPYHHTNTFVAFFLDKIHSLAYQMSFKICSWKLL